MITYHLSTKPVPQIMGILNITPDSFSDGGKYFEPENAVTHAIELIRDGADILDLGAESTRPGSEYITEAVEVERLEPVVAGIRSLDPDIPLSLDTRKARVAESCLHHGIQYINDISALRHDQDLTSLIANTPNLKIVLMHMLGEPGTMQANPQYNNVLDEVLKFLSERIDHCLSSGIKDEQILLDPGIGFGKNLEHNLTLLNNLSVISKLGYPVVLGASRKRFINEIYPSQPMERLGGTLASSFSGYCQDISILRVHDVAAHRQFFKVLTSILNGDVWTS